MSTDFGLAPNTRTFELIAAFHLNEASASAPVAKAKDGATEGAANAENAATSASDSLRSTFDMLYRSQEVSTNSRAANPGPSGNSPSRDSRGSMSYAMHPDRRQVSSQAFTGPVYVLPPQQQPQIQYSSPTSYRPQLAQGATLPSQAQSPHASGTIQQHHQQSAFVSPHAPTPPQQQLQRQPNRGINERMFNIRSLRHLTDLTIEEMMKIEVRGDRRSGGAARGLKVKKELSEG